MSFTDRITDGRVWVGIAEQIRDIGEEKARTWWNDNAHLLAEYARADIEAIAKGMQKGPEIARAAVFASLDPDEARVLFLAWMRDTRDELQGIARRRARLLEAFDELAGDLLRVVGRAIQAGLVAA